MSAVYSPLGVAKSLVDLGRHYARSRRADSSFAGEYFHLRSLADRLDLNSGFVVDIAASDGVRQSSTLGFFRRSDWRGLAVEMDPKKFSKLAFIYSQFENARLARVRVTPATVAPLLTAFEVPRDFSILNLDIDSYDLAVIDCVLTAGFRPKIISMEINEKIPSPIFFTVDFDEQHYWAGDHFFGCSATAAGQIVKPHGYVLESIQFNNAFFVRSDIAEGVFVDQDVRDAYQRGYVDQPHRTTLFPWNADVERLQHCSTDQAINEIRELFKSYDGKYTLRED